MRAKDSTQVDELTARQQRTIVALLQNVTVTGAAQAANVSEATLYRWLALPAFKDEFRKQRRMMFERAVGLAQRASAAAVGEIISIMRDGENEFARLAAARVILDLARASDVEERLEVLEEQLSAGDGEGSQLQLRRAS
jgi:phage terminase small subunit